MDGVESLATRCLNPRWNTQDCQLDIKVEEAIWNGDFEGERRKLRRANTPDKRKAVFDGIRKKVLPRIVSLYDRQRFNIVNDQDREPRCRVKGTFKVKRRFWRDNIGCSILTIWNPSDCVQPKNQTCLGCPVAGLYRDRAEGLSSISYDGERYFKQGFTPSDHDTLCLRVAEEYFA